MERLEAFRRFWPLSVVILLVTISGVFGLEHGRDATYAATGTVRISGPEVDPSRDASRAIDLAAAIAQASTTEVRDAMKADGGRDDYRMIQVSGTRLQVLANGEGSIQAVRAVLRFIADAVADQQRAADVSADERVRPRLIVHVPEDELDALAAVEGRLSGEVPEAIGTLLLEDHVAGYGNSLGNGAVATRLVLISIMSDAGSEAVTDTLPEGVEFAIGAHDRRAPEILTISTTGPNPDDVVRGFHLVSDSVAGELERRQTQAGVPSQARLLVDELAAPLEARGPDSGLSSLAMSVLLIGVGFALALPTILREVTARSHQDRPATAYHKVVDPSLDRTTVSAGLAGPAAPTR